MYAIKKPTLVLSIFGTFGTFGTFGIYVFPRVRWLNLGVQPKKIALFQGNFRQKSKFDSNAYIT